MIQTMQIQYTCVEYNNIINQSLQKVPGLIEVSNGYFYTNYVPEFIGVCWYCCTCELKAAFKITMYLPTIFGYTKMYDTT